MEKPDVLSEAEIDKAWPNKVAFDSPITWEKIVDELGRCGRLVAQAQLDAAVEYYEPQIKVASETCERLTKALEQARQDTAREIFGAIERESETPFNSYYDIKIIKPRYQSLKSKFLIHPNPVGSGDV